MARIRTIKPEFWSDDKLAQLDPLTRLVFLGLISQADDAGRVLDSPKMINGILFPVTDDDSTACLELLSTLGVISRGLTANGQRVIQIVGWQKHQKIEKPNLRAALPALVPPSKVRRRLPDTSGNGRGGPADPSPEDQDLDQDLDQDQEREGISAHTREDATLDGFTPTDEHRALALELGHDPDALLTDWRLQRKASGTAPADLDADFERWIRRERQFTPNGNGARAQADTGIVRRFEPLPPEPDEPPPDPELRKAGFDLVRQAVNGVRSPAETDAEISDPEVIAKREARKAQLKAQARALATTEKP